MGSPSQAQSGLGGLLEGLGQGVESSQRARMQQAYLAAMLQRYQGADAARVQAAQAGAGARLGAAQIYGDTRDYGYDQANEGVHYRVDNPAPPRGGAPGSSVHLTPFDQTRANALALQAAGYTAKDSAGNPVPVDFSQMTADQANKYNTVMRNEVNGYNASIQDPTRRLQPNGDALMPLTPATETQPSSFAGLQWGGGQPVAAKFGPNPKFLPPQATTAPASAPAAAPGASTSGGDYSQLWNQ